MNQLFGCFVNALTTDYEIRRNYPSPALYYSPLLHPTHPHACPRWSARGTRAVGRSVGRWFQISHAIQVCRFIHLGDAHSKQWAALNASSLWAYLVDALNNIHEVDLWLIYGINVLPGFWHIIWACGLSTSAVNGRDFMVCACVVVEGQQLSTRWH